MTLAAMFNTQEPARSEAAPMLLFATSVLPRQADRTDEGVAQPRRLWGLHLSAGGLWDLQNVDLLLQDAQLVRGAAVDC